MKANGTLRNIALLFVGVLVIYVLAYYGIEHRRTRLGAWRVTFTNAVSGAPALVIQEPALGITNVQIVFPNAGSGQPYSNATVVFDQPREVPYALPFGQCIFMDTTFLPGTVVLQAYGHEVQLLPRVLTLDNKEHPWQSAETHLLSATNNSSAMTTNATDH
ncbi:MAG: hypothetical protein ACTHLW_07375 [Verrucomicrobiota bacterium]